MTTEVLRKITKPIFYITNDVSRAVGLENIIPNYHIVCLDDHSLVDTLLKRGISVFCLERELGKKNEIFRNAGTILSHPLVLSFIKEKSREQKPNIVFFKPQKRIELISAKHGFNLVGNSLDLSRIFEDKISFFKLCRENDIKTTPSEVFNLGGIDYSSLVKNFGDQFVVQFGRGWAGNSTFFVKSEEELLKIKKEYPNIKVKVSSFIKGITVLNNVVIYKDGTIVGKPAIQIKAEQILTSTQAGTGGRQWPAIMDKRQEKEIEATTLKVASLMRERGYKGFFGLDFLIEEKSGEIFISENNARITASTPFYTKLELAKGFFPLLGLHLLSFLDEPQLDISDVESPGVVGAEIVARNNFRESLMVENSIKNGIYSEALKFIRESYSLDTDLKEEFWLETPARGRLVNPEIELIRLNTLDSVCDKTGSLCEKYMKIISDVKKRLGLKCVN